MTTRTLHITHSDGRTEAVPVRCGSDWSGRRLPARIGRALIDCTATAVLDYDGQPRAAIESGGRYYMRTMDPKVLKAWIEAQA